MIKIMFVCHGNICRSPMAEFILKNLVFKENLQNYFEISSSATSSEEIGNDLYSSVKIKLNEKGIPFAKRKARKFTESDYRNYDYIFAMDQKNLENLRLIVPDTDHKIRLLAGYGKNQKKEILDPWYTGDFETCFRQIHESCTHLLQYLLTKNKEEKVETCAKENLVYQGRIIKLYNDDIKIGEKNAQREYVKHPGGVCALAYDEAGYIYLVRQYRYPYHDFLLEIPAGKLEKAENPDLAILRELKEEIGVDESELKKITVIYPTVGYSDEALHLYFARILKKTDALPDDDEYLSTHRFLLKDLLEMIQKGSIRDAKTMIAILMFAQNQNMKSNE